MNASAYRKFRALFGIYLAIHFVQLVPWAAEMFSSEGALPDAALSPLVGIFPSLLTWFDAPLMVQGLLVVLAGISVLFAAGVQDRLLAVVLWYGWASLFCRNPLILNPGLPYVGWLLLAHALMPSAGRLFDRNSLDPRWRIPPLLVTAAWVVMAVGYSYAGYTKLVSPSWMDGSALRYVLDSPLARPGVLRELLLSMPAAVLLGCTWVVLALEILYAPLALIKRLRLPLWLAMVVMHLGIIVLVDFADLSLGMLMIHAFTFDPRWLPAQGAIALSSASTSLASRAVIAPLRDHNTVPRLSITKVAGSVDT
jgi:hypothetical protein